MNEAYKNLVERRSVRKYNNKKVSHDLVEKIIYAGQCAPSGMNRQIFAFVAVEDEELVKEFCNILRKEYLNERICKM